MKNWTRRRLLLAAAVTAPLAILGARTWQTGVERHSRSAIARVFGADVAQAEPTNKFIAAWIAQLETDGVTTTAFRSKAAAASIMPEALLDRIDAEDEFVEWIIYDFAVSSTIIRHKEAGSALEFFGLSTLQTPYERPCINTLSAYWL